METLCIFLQAVVETYVALAADIPLVIALAQAALQLLNHLVKHIQRKNRPQA